MKYLILQNNALKAQNEIAMRAFGYEVYDSETDTYYNPWTTTQPFQTIEHPTTDFSAIVIPDDIQYGMRDGLDWTRGKEREYNNETITGKPSLEETVNRLYPTNRPLKDYQYMIDNGWFDEG